MAPDLAFVLTSVLVLIVVFALVREVRLRRGLERWLFRLLVLWRDRNGRAQSPRSFAMAVRRAAGPLRLQFSRRPVVELSRQSLDRQANPSEQLARQGQTINEAAHRLVAADAEARREFLAATRALQAEREQLGLRWAELDRQRDEDTRAAQREPVIANAIQASALFSGCALPLVLGLVGAWNLSCPRADAEALGERLVHELASNRPRLLPADLFDELPPPPRGGCGESADHRPSA